MPAATAVLPPDLLKGKPPRPSAAQIVQIPDTQHLHKDEQPVAIVLDNVFSAQECEKLVELAAANNTWERAQINLGGPKRRSGTVDDQVRNSDRILWDSPEVTDLIWQRVEPLLTPEVTRVSQRPRVTGAMAALQGEIWRAVGLNERLRFLRYGAGEFFAPHFDGQFARPGGKKSLFTLHLYLNERTDDNELEGGATVMHAPDYDPAKDVPVEAKIGRVLVFQQRDILHSGQQVSGGLKLTMRTDVMYALDKDRVPPEERMTLAQVRGKC